MKKMKKILSVILTLAMVLGMSVTTFAETTEEKKPTPATGTNKDTGSITLDGFELVKDGDESWKLPSGLTITAYQVVKAVYANNQNFTPGEEEGDDPTANDNGSFSNYEAVYGEEEVGEGKAIEITPVKEETKDIPSINISEEQLTAVWNYITTQNKSEDSENHILATKEVSVNDSNAKKDNEKHTFSVTLDKLPVGSYLIAITGGEGKIYNPMVASIYYNVTKDEDGNSTGNILNEEGLNFSITSTDGWVKVTNEPSVEKSIIEKATTGEGENAKTTITNESGGSANIGGEIEYQVVINPIPEYGGEHPALRVEDTLSSGLEYVPNSLKVEIYEANADLTNPAHLADCPAEGEQGEGKRVATLSGENAANYYKLTEPTENDRTLKVNFVLEETGETTKYNYTLNEYVARKAVITYKVVLTDKALVNEGGNENNVVLNYTRDSRTSTDDGKPEEVPTDSKTYSYTFDIDGGVAGEGKTDITVGMLTKTGEKYKNEKGEWVVPALENAKFTLYTVDPSTFKPKDENDKIENYIYKQTVGTGQDSVKFSGTVTSNKDGRLPIRGLKAGTKGNPQTYYLMETEAPSGYSLNSHVFKIEIEAEYYTQDQKEGEKITFHKGELKNWKVTIDGEDTPTGNGKAENAFEVTLKGETKVIKVNGAEADNEGKYDIHGVEIKNTKIASLPSTGGIGTTIFTVGGCAIMILAAALFFISRRKSSVK